MEFWLVSFANEDPNEIQTRELKEALAQIKNEFDEANRTHARELAEAREGWKKAEETLARELAEVREGWEKAKETHEREINEARSKILQLQASSKLVSHWMAP